jgi:hypothetical protein
VASGWSVRREVRGVNWSLAIARFKALSALRRRPDEELDDETAAGIEDPADSPETALEKKDKSAIIRKCLAGLSAEHREIIDLVYQPLAGVEHARLHRILRDPDDQRHLLHGLLVVVWRNC